MLYLVKEMILVTAFNEGPFMRTKVTTMANDRAMWTPPIP